MFPMELIVDGTHGRYAPMFFMEQFQDDLQGVDPVDVDIVLGGPDEELYWECWATIAQDGYVPFEGNDWTIYEYEGDIWLVHPEHEFEEE